MLKNRNGILLNTLTYEDDSVNEILQAASKGTSHAPPTITDFYQTADGGSLYGLVHHSDSIRPVDETLLAPYSNLFDSHLPQADGTEITQYFPDTTPAPAKQTTRSKVPRAKSDKSRGQQGVKKDRPWLQSSVFVFDAKDLSKPQIIKSKGFTRTLDDKALRDRGACFRCRMWRKKVCARWCVRAGTNEAKCDLGSPCQNCRNDPDRCADPTLVIAQPCFRLDLDDCGFFRTSQYYSFHLFYLRC
jgi:hypothetical protein